MMKFIAYTDEKGKKKIRRSNEEMKREDEIRNRKKKLQKKNEWLNRWIEKRRTKRQERYVEYLIGISPRDKLNIRTIRRFVLKIDVGDDDECWNWLASYMKDGYGKFKVDKKTFLAHRFHWILKHGNVTEGACVLHKCDNPKCVNIKHLFIGTQKDNIDDKVVKGRCNYARGEMLPQTTHDNELVKEIRNRYENGEFQSDIAEHLNVSRSYVCEIVNNTKRKINNYKVPVLHKKSVNSETCHVSKLNWSSVREIRKRYREGEVTVTRLAEEYNISAGAISLIINNKTWVE